MLSVQSMMYVSKDLNNACSFSLEMHKAKGDFDKVLWEGFVCFLAGDGVGEGSG